MTTVLGRVPSVWRIHLRTVVRREIRPLTKGGPVGHARDARPAAGLSRICCCDRIGRSTTQSPASSPAGTERTFGESVLNSHSRDGARGSSGAPTVPERVRADEDPDCD
jgi:hypothetical protein